MTSPTVQKYEIGRAIPGIGEPVPLTHEIQLFTALTMGTEIFSVSIGTVKVKFLFRRP
jgi:hypothetical protein